MRVVGENHGCHLRKQVPAVLKSYRLVNFTDSKIQLFHESSSSLWQRRSPSLS